MQQTRRLQQSRATRNKSESPHVRSQNAQHGLSLRPALGSPICHAKRPAANTDSPGTYSWSRQIFGNHPSLAKATLGKQK